MSNYLMLFHVKSKNGLASFSNHILSINMIVFAYVKRPKVN